MIVPLPECSKCGCDELHPVPDDDPSTGYRGETWVCAHCGATGQEYYISRTSELAEYEYPQDAAWIAGCGAVFASIDRKGE